MLMLLGNSSGKPNLPVMRATRKERFLLGLRGNIFVNWRLGLIDDVTDWKVPGAADSITLFHAGFLHHFKWNLAL
jgi:hypothetical protein